MNAEAVMHATNEVNLCDLYRVEEMMFIVNELKSLAIGKSNRNFEQILKHLRILCYAAPIICLNFVVKIKSIL